MIERVITKRRRDLGGFEVGRVLPYAGGRMVGPFIFFDHMGPVSFPAGIPRSVDVRSHPHIGLATVTYLFEGEVMHRDSVGSEQPIRPGEVNWMTAGRGITHSERFERARREGDRMHGIQAWVALPAEDEEIEPAFAHHGPEDLPAHEREGAWMRHWSRSSRADGSPRFVLSWYFVEGARSNWKLHFNHSFVHTIQVRRLEKNLAARPCQSVAACLEKAADLGGDEVRVLREADPNAYCHAFNGFKLAQLYDCTSRDVALGLVCNCVAELDIEFILLELWGMRYNDQRVWVPLWQELPRFIAQLDNKPTRCAE